MTLRLLVALAGVLAADQTPSAQRPGADGLLTVQSQKDFELAPESQGADPGPLRLQNRRTGVTCAMRIVPVRPSVDPGILRLVPSEGFAGDSMIRNQHSPCVE